MSEKYTMGPWRIGAPPPNGEQTIGTNQGLMVAVATTGSGIPTKANAHLIAAAPELLWVVRLAISPFDGKPDSECPNWVKPARAAILKATGEQA